MMDIKNQALYQFIQLYSIQVNSLDVYLGFNMTKGKDQLYADGSIYNFNDSYDFGGENINFGGMDCVYLKKGIGFKPREIECSHVLDFYCVWQCTLHIYTFDCNDPYFSSKMSGKLYPSFG